MRTASILAVVALLGAVGYYLWSAASPSFEPVRPIQYRVKVTPPGDGGQSPTGCDIVVGAHRILGAKPKNDWVPTTYSLCQLPAPWREAVVQSRVGEEVEYFIPGAEVPAEIAKLLGVTQGSDLSVGFRMDAVRDPPLGLRFPERATVSDDADTLPDGVRYVVHPSTKSGAQLDEDGAAIVAYSFWKLDGTLVATSYLNPTPTVLSVANMRGYVKGLLSAVSGEGDEILAWLPPNSAGVEEPLLLHARIVKVMR